MRQLTWTACAVALLALFATEAAFFAGELSPWRWYAGLSWIVISAAVVLSALASAFPLFFGDWFRASPHRAWYLTAFFLPPVLILFNAGGTTFTSVDIEGLQQLASGVFMLRHDTSLGVLSMAYSRYMGRQFVLNSLPTLFFGPSLWAARIGNSMFYIASYCFFLSALVAYLRERRDEDPLLFSGYCGIMIAFGQYALLNARKFEQTMMPVGCMLFFLAALLHFAARPGPLKFLWLTWAFGFFTGCYTPAIGGWVLALAVLLHLAIRRRQPILLVPVAYGIACLCIAYLVMHRADPAALPHVFTVGTGEHFTASDWIFRALNGVRAVVGTDFTLIEGPQALAILAAIYLGWRFRDHRYAAVCAWAAAIFVLSVALLGTGFVFPNRDIERSLVVIPPLMLGAVLLLIRYMSTVPEGRGAAGAIRFCMKLSMGYMVFTGIFTVLLVRNFFGTPMPDDEDEAYALINRLVNSSAVQPKKFYQVPPMHMDLPLGLQYFAPDAAVVFARPPEGESVPGVYVFSYLKSNPADRFDDEVAPSRHPRPFIRMDRE